MVIQWVGCLALAVWWIPGEMWSPDETSQDTGNSKNPRLAVKPTTKCTMGKSISGLMALKNRDIVFAMVQLCAQTTPLLFTLLS